MNNEDSPELRELLSKTVANERAKALGRPVRGKDVVLVINGQRVEARADLIRELFESGALSVASGVPELEAIRKLNADHEAERLRKSFEPDFVRMSAELAKVIDFPRERLTSSKPIRHSGMNRAQRRAEKRGSK